MRLLLHLIRTVRASSGGSALDRGARVPKKLTYSIFITSDDNGDGLISDYIELEDDLDLGLLRYGCPRGESIPNSKAYITPRMVCGRVKLLPAIIL